MELEPTIISSDDTATFQYLRWWLDQVCHRIAAKFNIYNSKGKPRKAFIIDTLMKYSCPGCIVKALTTHVSHEYVDDIFRENHRLAVNLLVERLRQRLTVNGSKSAYAYVQGEVPGEYGRVDVLVKPISCGVLVKLKNVRVIVEVKTGKSFSYIQLFRYLIQNPNSVIVVWRVKMRQIFVLDGRKMCVRALLLALMETAINRGLYILNMKNEQCSHNPINSKKYEVENPQQLIDDFTDGLMQTLDHVVNVIDTIINYDQPVC